MEMMKLWQYTQQEVDAAALKTVKVGIEIWYYSNRNTKYKYWECA